MPRCLILALQGVLQAWGKHSYETLRPTELFPTRSGLSGFFAAALGITREEQDELLLLDKSYVYAARCDSEFDGRKLQRGLRTTDFHTVKNVRTVSGRDTKDTEVTHREYLEDQCFTVAVMESGGARYSLDGIAEAIQKPAFALHLGRKSCPLCTPPFVGFCEAEDLHDALMKQPNRGGTVYSEEPTEGCFTMPVRDVPMGGRRFDTRKVYCYEMEES